MLRAATTYVTFLVVVSCLYYVSFWWVFDFDILPFFEPQDFLLGIIFPFKYSGVYFVSAIMFIVLTSIFIPVGNIKQAGDLLDLDSVDDIQGKEQSSNAQRIELDEEYKDKLKKFDKYLANHLSKLKIADILVGVLISIGIVFIIWRIVQSPQDKYQSALVGFLVAQLFHMIMRNADLWPDNLLGVSVENQAWVYLVDHVFIMLIVFLPVSAIANGYSESQSIVKGKRFHYALCKDLPEKLNNSRHYMVYIGKVNDVFVFSDSANTETIVIDKGDLPVLRVHAFDCDDKKTVNTFRELVH